MAMKMKSLQVRCPRCTGFIACYLNIILLLFLLTATETWAEDKIPEFFTFTFENDIFLGNDDGYTNGTGITFSKGPFREFNNDDLPGWLYWFVKDLYISTMEHKQRGVAHMFFQRMQTPEDLSETALIKNDIPYAGLLAWQGTLFAWDEQISDQLSLYLGTVGPNAFAEETQNFIHQIVNSDEAKGWDNQIKNEWIFKVEVQRVWRLYCSNGNDYKFDILGLAGAGIGNLESATKAGFAIRWGSHLQSSFPTFSLQADRQVNPLALSVNNDFYLFLGARLGVVFNDILIDGNTFKESHSVPLDHYQNQISAGAVWNSGTVSYVLQVSSLSSRTTLTDEREDFGALSVTFRY